MAHYSAAMLKRRKWDREEDHKLPDRQLFDDLPLLVSSITAEERLFLREWCQARSVGDNYVVVATTFWLRCKSHTYASSLMFAEAKKVYMILCIHLTLKHLGYEEVHKCNFFADLKEVYPSMTAHMHQDMEWEVFRCLNFDLGI